MASAPASAQKKPTAYSSISGTVFVEPGFSLPGVEVVISRKDGAKWKRVAQVDTSFRGEFSFELPAVDATYQLRCAPKGYTADMKEVTLTGEEHTDVNLVLMKVGNAKNKEDGKK